MKQLLKLFLTITILAAGTFAFSAPIFKYKTDFIIVKDSKSLLRHEITTYNFLCLKSNSNWGTYKETLTFDYNNRLIKKSVVTEKISRSTRDLPHVIIEKTLFYRKGRKTKMTYIKRISDGYSTLASKVVTYHRDGSKTVENHTKGTDKVSKEPRRLKYVVVKN